MPRHTIRTPGASVFTHSTSNRNDGVETANSFVVPTNNSNSYMPPFEKGAAFGLTRINSSRRLIYCQARQAELNTDPMRLQKTTQIMTRSTDHTQAIPQDKIEQRHVRPSAMCSKLQIQKSSQGIRKCIISGRLHCKAKSSTLR